MNSTRRIRRHRRLSSSATTALTKNLVDAANAVIEKNKIAEKYSTTEKAVGAPIVVDSARSADEARWIALTIRGLMRGGMKPEEVAIFFRTNFQSRALGRGTTGCVGVPYKLIGTKFFARREVKDALAWMRLALDPSREVDTALRGQAAPPRGLGKVTLGKLAVK